MALFASKGSPETKTPGRILPGALSYRKEYTTAVKFFTLEISAAQHKKSESYFRSAQILDFSLRLFFSSQHTPSPGLKNLPDIPPPPLPLPPPPPTPPFPPQ